MFLLVQAYDVMDQMHVRLRLVDDGDDGQILVTRTKLNWDAHRPADVKSDRDVIAWLGEELIEAAHSETPLL